MRIAPPARPARGPRTWPARGILPAAWAGPTVTPPRTVGGVVLDMVGFGGIGPIGADGTVEVGAGVSMGQLIDHAVPRGWFVPVTPGTRHVTLGGALAADVHGKNHHRDASIGAHVDAVTLVDGLGDVRALSAGDEHSVP